MHRCVATMHMLFAAMFIVLSAACVTNASSSSTTDTTEPTPISYELHRGSTTEVLVDMGIVSRSTIEYYDINLCNTTDTTLLLLDYEATCRCVWLDLPREPLAPKDSTSIRLWFDSRGEWGTVGNYIGVSTSLEDIAIAVWMSAEVE